MPRMAGVQRINQHNPPHEFVTHRASNLFVLIVRSLEKSWELGWAGLGQQAGDVACVIRRFG